MSKTEKPVPSGDELRRLAESLTAGSEAEVLKAADDEKADAKNDEKKDADKKEDVEKAEKPEGDEIEKSVTLTEGALTTLIEKAVTAGFEKAQAALDDKLAPITKNLETLTGDSSAIRQFQGATTMVLTNLKDNGEALGQEVNKLREVSKSIQDEVEAIGNQPAPRRSSTGVEKSAETKNEVNLDIDKVKEIAKSMDDIADAVSIRKYAAQGNVDALRGMLTPLQRRALGL